MQHTPDEPEAPRPDGQLVELAGRRRVVPDELAVCVGRGARVLVFSDLRLTNPASDISREVCRSVARAIEECRGPGAIVFAGDMFDLRDGTDVEGALLAHPRLSAALAAFVAGADHRLIVLPGMRDGALAHDHRAIDAVTALGGEVALDCVLEVDTGVGSRLVHVEPGHRLDPSAAFIDPRDPNDRPLAQHLVREIGPNLASAADSNAWLTGIDDLVDRSQAGAFVASAPCVPAPAASLGLARRSGARGVGIVLVVLRAHRSPDQREPVGARHPAARRRADTRARRGRGGARVHDHAVAERARQRLVVGAAAARQRRRARRSGHARGRRWRRDW